MILRQTTSHGLVIIALLSFLSQPIWAATKMKILTGPENGIQPQIAANIAEFVAPAANISLDIITTAGPVDTLQRLQRLPNSNEISLAFLSSDTAHAYNDAATRGSPEANQLLAPVRLLAPLYNEEIYFVVRSDSSYNSLHDIKNARINVGPLKSGTALTTTALYRLLFDEAIPDDKAVFLSYEEALVKLITDQSVDVVAIVAAAPARLLAEMKPQARRYVKLLKFDPTRPNSNAVLMVYGEATVRATNYPNLLDEDMPGLSLKSYLVAYGIHDGETDTQLARLMRAWCQNLPRMSAEGHPKWREVEIVRPDGIPGWNHARSAARELAACPTGNAAALPAPCTQQQRVLGLCE